MTLFNRCWNRPRSLKDRVRAAIRNSGCSFPMRRITVNPSTRLRAGLAPAELKKESLP